MIKISEYVKYALDNNLPVVALESTIISFGMPYPENVNTALKAEQIIKDNGAVPATIAIIKGVITIGLSKDEIEYLGRSANETVKTSTRDIPYVVSKGLTGATTVSATSKIASMANIKVFATGGIGGVHRKAEETFDISSDLEEISETNIAIVSAGAKAILDLNKTLEYLETKRIEVIGYKTKYFPAFYTAKSEYLVNHTLNTPLEIAKVMYAKWQLGIKGGILIANPIPLEYSMDNNVINEAIENALIELEKLNITGNQTTPYLLSKVKELTKGNSLKANIELVYNNCILASKIAKEFSKLNN